uniref:Uncharacterized protein n=1 Tax=Tanacetum cinerariifolium TaxID=118510 RepID=A0A6L2JLV1_TANCI|nr:hypothetical protein [Tanacetum cinerariifolium]
MSSSTVNYTSVYTDSELWRFLWVSDDELEAPDAAPQSSGQAPPSPDYVPEDEEEEEHLAPVDSSVVPVIDLVPSAEDTEASEIDEFAPTPPSPRHRRAGICVRLPSPTVASIEAIYVKSYIIFLSKLTQL